MNSTFLAIHLGRLSSAPTSGCACACVGDSMASNLHDENCTTFVSFPIVHCLLLCGVDDTVAAANAAVVVISLLMSLLSLRLVVVEMRKLFRN